MRKKPGKLTLRAVLSAALIVSLLMTGAAYRASAEEDVSPTDVSAVSVQQEAEQAESDEAEAHDGTETGIPARKEAASIVVRREAQDFLLSSGKVRRNGTGTKFNRFLPSASFDGNYKSELDENEKKFYQGLYDTFVTGRNPHTAVVSVELDPPMEFNVVYSNAEKDEADDRDLVDIDDAILSAAAAFFYDCPEAFWIRSFSYSINFTFSEDGTVGHVNLIQFLFSQASYPNAYDDLAGYDAGLTAAVSSIRNSRVNESTYETVKAIHDYICANASYEYAALSGSSYTYGYAYSAAPLFTGKGKFVCEGYSKAMKILCNEFGINCVLVSGIGKPSDSTSGPHMWNYVRMGDGTWYAVDATWDDGYTYSDGSPAMSYNYFLVGSTTWVKNNKTFAQEHTNDGQVMSSDTKFEMVYPVLSSSAYDRYIVDTDPKITLTTLGASIRISDPYGIRFGIQIKRDEGLSSVHHIPEFGTLIIASGTLGDNELTINTPNVRKIRANNIYSQDETQYTYTGVLINIPKTFFGTNVKGRGYLIYIDDETGQEHIIYSETVERSFYGVAQSAYDSYSRIENPDDSQKAIIEKLKGFLDNQ